MFRSLEQQEDMLMGVSDQINTMKDKANKDEMPASLEQQQDLLEEVSYQASVVKETMDIRMQESARGWKDCTRQLLYGVMCPAVVDTGSENLVEVEY